MTLIKNKKLHLMQLKLKKIFLLFIILGIYSCKNVKTEYWENGNKMSEIEYSGKVQNGRARWWYQNGNIQMDVNYKDGKIEGTLSRNFISGQKEVIKHFKGGKLDGLMSEWDEKGNKISEINYANDSLNGKYTLWYPNGIVKLEANYNNGSYEGIWISYNDRGFVIGKANFKSGDGIMESFDIKGIKMMESHFEKNLKEGKETVYDADGKVIEVRLYKKGKLISQVGN